MVQIPEKTITLEEFLKLPETKPASEYMNGQVIQKPMPQGKHSTIQGELVTAINAAVKKQRIALAFPELRCTFGDRSCLMLRCLPGIESRLTRTAILPMFFPFIPIGQLRFFPLSRVKPKSPEISCTVSNTGARWVG